MLSLGPLTACAPSPIETLGGADAILEGFRDLHTKVYGVYSLGLDRDAIHDRLASAFAGDALTREYVEHFTTLARMRDEGTAIDVLAVDYESVTLAGVEPEGVLVDADWSVGGIVSHQRHKHHRVNRYHAIYTLAMAANENGEQAALHIVDTRMRDAERVAAPIDSTHAFPLDELPSSKRGFMGPAELLRSGILDPAPDAAPRDADPAQQPSSGNSGVAPAVQEAPEDTRP